MNSDLWRWADPEGQQRKVRFDELRAALAGGLIAPNTPVWRSGWAAWQPAHQVPELTSAADGGANGVLLNIPPPPLAMLAVQQEYEASSSSIVPASQPAALPSNDDEPPPPPLYVPLPSKLPSIHPSSSPMKTVLGGSAHIPAAPALPAFPERAAGVAPGSEPKLGPSLPTTIGVPPPPELLAAVKAAPIARAKSVPPPPPRAASRPPLPPSPAPVIGPESPVEELSGSMLLDTNSSAVKIDRAGPVRGDPARGELDEEDIAGVTRRPGLDLIIDDLKLLKNGKPPKNKLVMGILGAVALLFVILLIAGIASLAIGPKATKTAKPSPSASASETTVAAKAAPASSGVSTIVAPPFPAAPPASDLKPTGKVFGDCTTAGETKTIATRAQIASGIEAHSVNGGIALGFAPGPRDGVATMIDVSSLSPTSTARTKPTGGDTRRVTPAIVGGKLSAIVDVDRKGDKITFRRAVAASTLVDIGQAEGRVVWAPHGTNGFAKLFELDGDTAVEALRGVPLADRKGIVLTFRRGNSINVGVAKGDASLEAEGDLSKIAGTGQVGSPSVTVSGDRVVVAWADRTGNTEDWGIRWAKFPIGGGASEGTPFAIPEGGLGGQAMSPSVASLGGGRFFLAWTEGPVSSHQVRGITFGADGSPSGSPLAISPPGVNAGQPAAVVGPDGRGVVAFLAAKGKTLEVHAMPLSCPAR